MRESRREKPLAGLTAIVTGAGNGLGRAHAHMLAGRGANVVVNDPGVPLAGGETDKSRADTVVAEITAAGGAATANYCSVTETNGGQKIIATALHDFGGVDILVNNAGILRDKTFLKTTLDEFMNVFNVHFTGTLNVTHAAFPIMKDRGFGRIVMTTSVTGLYGNFGQTAYGAAKAAVTGLMRSLALEGARYNILTNAIAPLAATRMAGDLYEGRENQFDPSHVAALAATLCDPASTTNGQVAFAAGRHFALLEQRETAGLHFPEDTPITPELLAESWGKITDAAKSVSIDSVAASVRKAEGAL